jgi:hypothetical protein
MTMVDARQISADELERIARRLRRHTAEAE